MSATPVPDVRSMRSVIPGRLSGSVAADMSAVEELAGMGMRDA
jgi:hypothetical protein